ncbi:MAG TPA: hypothetical protein PKY67_05385 [Nitrosomonas sp.]|nr:hypothetical protein [Nitrosomonas sp.]
MTNLFAYNLMGRDEELVIWVGIRGSIPSVSGISFKIAGKSVQPKKTDPKFEYLGSENSQNYRAIFIFDWPNISTRFNIEIGYDGKTVELTSKRPPQYLPKLGEDSFRLLLSSCYYQPNDKTPAHLGTILREHIKPPQDFTYLAGDQVYLDLPSHQNLPTDRDQLAQTLEAKYLANWFSDQPDQSEQPNLSYLLKCGPVLCIPDDHEYWNNFPYRQTQLNNTHSKNDRKNWKDLADLLYQRYQMTPGQQDGFFRMDIEPLYMLFIDGRRFRDEGKEMFNAASWSAIEQWTQDLLQLKKSSKSPVVGLLSSGQALLMEKSNSLSSHVLDAEMPNFPDHEKLISKISQLINAGIPIIYITGDVHWGRIVEGKDSANNTMFYEIIASPSRLQDFIFKDQFNWLKNKLIGSKESKDFPEHPPPEKIPDIKLANLDLSVKHKQLGDHVAMLNFNTIPGGISLTVDYICTDKDRNKRRIYSETINLEKILNPN